ncbi:MAG: hypothetical protein D6809_06185, partial [Gammaproteobacteria bacterium]
MALASGAALAAPPVAFDGWQASGGQIMDSTGTNPLETTCPTGFSCGAALTGDGFFQRQITDNNTGAVYFQTIVTDLGVTGTPANLSFSDESYVKRGAGAGVADKQHMDSTTPGQGTLTTTSVLNMGWAHANGTPDVDIRQTVSDAATGLTSRMNFQQNRDAQGVATGTALDLDQTIVLDANVTPNDKQGFALRKRSGDLNNTAHAAATDPVLLPAGATGQNMDWGTTDEIQVVWIGQAVTTTAGNQDKFGYQGYTNFTTNNTISYFDTASFGDTAGKGGWNWQDPPFGP